MLDNINDFEQEWAINVSKFNLEANKHIKGLYEVKQYWVSSYLHGHFFRGMITTETFDDINRCEMLYLSCSCVIQLFKQEFI